VKKVTEKLSKAIVESESLHRTIHDLTKHQKVLQADLEFANHELQKECKKCKEQKSDISGRDEKIESLEAANIQLKRYI